MSKARVLELQGLAIAASQVSRDGQLTRPRTWGVYDIGKQRLAGKRFRIGNHPVRQHELVREVGKATLIGLFTQRKWAEELARLLNGQSVKQ